MDQDRENLEELVRRDREEYEKDRDAWLAKRKKLEELEEERISKLPKINIGVREIRPFQNQDALDKRISS